MKKSFLYGAMTTGLLFTACNSDAPLAPEEGGSVAEIDKTMFVKLAIHGSEGMGTRAAADDGNPVEGTDFEDGTGNESKVSNAYFVFYDAAGNVVGDIVNVPVSQMKEEVGTDGTVEKFYAHTVEVSVPKGQTTPTQVVCYINPLTPAALKSDLQTVQTVTRSEVTSDAGFPMSNSVYYLNNAGDPVITVDVNGKLYDTPEEAEGAPAVDIYVERYASKLAFSAAEAEAYTTHTSVVSTDGTATETPVTLSFVADRWALNAEATSTYVLKSFRQPSDNGQILGTSYTFADLNTVINGTGATATSWAWNNSNYHRSYWAISPAYFTETYPTVADDLKDGTWAGQQKYYTLADLNAGAGFAGNNTTAQYFRETTVGSRALASENPRAAMPAVILVGHYTVAVNGTDAGQKSFYTYLKGSDDKPLVYFEADAQGNSEVAGGESMINRFFNALTVLYKKDGDKYVRFNPADATDKAKLLSILEIADPADEVATDVAARFRTLQLKANANTTGIYIANGNGYEEIGTGEGMVSILDANKALYQQVGMAAYYINGAAYFNIPVLHYGWYRAGNPNAAAGATGNIDWNKVNVGDFGMVRNHSYKVNVSKIAGLGTGIAGVDDPIVPPADTKEQYISYRVNILKWAVVPTQNVELN